MTEAPTVVRYEPRGAARDLFACRADEVVLDGPAGTGKSLGCLFKMHLTALAAPGMRGLIVRKWAVTLASTTLVTFEKKVIAEALATGVATWFGGSQREAPGYRYSNGSALVVGGMDKPGKIMSSEYDLVFGDEATELDVDDWEAFSTRLRNGVLTYQQQMGACNPSGPAHWLKKRADDGKLTMLHSRHRDNPAYVNADGTYTQAGEAYILGKLGNLTGVRKLRLGEGKWAAAEGLVYSEFDDAVHVVESLPAGSEQWTRWWSIDFGFMNPFVCQFWAEDPDGRLWLYREIYRTQRLVEDHALDILATVRKPRTAIDWEKAGRDPDPKDPADWEWTEPQPRQIICDHDAEDRATLQRHLGLGTTPARKTVSDGIQAVESRLKVQRDGKPRLFLVRDALVERDELLEDAKLPMCTYEELGCYVWPVGVRPEKRENPVKENDHGADAMRYMVAQRDLGARPRFRSFAY